ncbi:MAG: NADH-quinone oxidoreductase subunit N [marine bacterium B5-7]|nr:MAG: NADH-quinone oxidoreductase subunit N [marine bacterium B5-7]
MNASVQFLPVLPEIVVALMACAVLVVDLFLDDDRRQISYLMCIATFIVTLVLLIKSVGGEPQVIFNGAIVIDDLSAIIKIGVVLSALLLFVYGRQYNLDRNLFKGEWFVLVMLGVVGMMVLASANHLVTLYMGLELLSLCLYAMIAMRRDSSVAAEAAMKYFVLGALASGILLYGMSLIYGLTGSLEFRAIAESIQQMDSNALPLTLGLIFIVVGLAFKLGAVPFHMWVPDVYDGAPISATIFIGTAPKLAAFAMMARLLVSGFGDLHDDWGDMLLVIAILSVAVGNIVAIAQTNIKRMLAYSTISHMGFFLFGILAGTEQGYGASLFYVLIYTTMSLGAFGVLLVLSTKGFEAENLDDLAGLNATHPGLALLMMLMMFSMAGVPPTVGFYAKLSVIQALLSVNHITVAVIAVLLAVVGAFYYLRVIKIMYFDSPPESRDLIPQRMAVGLLSVNALSVIGIMPFAGYLIDLCQRAVTTLP